MKIKDIPRLKEHVMSMLPVTQADVWKPLGLNSQDGSELIKFMLYDKLIKRTRVKIEGKETFLLERANGNGSAKKIDFTVLLSGNKFSPCCGCEEYCLPANCMKLTAWVAGN